MPYFDFRDALFAENKNSEKYAARLKKEVDEGLLPFLTLPFFEKLCEDIENLRPYFSKYKHFLLLGIGGSALGPRALQKAYAPSQDRPMHNGKSLWIMDNIEPEAFSDTLARLPKKETLVVTISKSGGTIETLSQYFIIKDAFKKELGTSFREHFLHVTDKEKGFLREEVDKYGFSSLEVPDNLGGRYSVLSAVGMLPAAFLDIDYKSMMQGAVDIGRTLAKDFSKLQEHEAWKLACYAKDLIDNGYSQLLLFMYHPAWATFGAWFVQLWAESLGKEGKGSMPICALGVTDQHSSLQMFLDGPKDKGCLFITSSVDLNTALLPESLPEVWDCIKNKPLGKVLEAETLATRMVLIDNKVPLVHGHFPKADCYEAGQFIQLLELATILTGWLLDINPIDQPAVEQGKRYANAKLGSKDHVQYLAKLIAFENRA